MWGFCSGAAGVTLTTVSAIMAPLVLRITGDCYVKLAGLVFQGVKTPLF